MSTVTGLVGELRKETRGVVRDVVLGVGSVVTKVDNGRVCALSVVTGCEFVCMVSVVTGCELVCMLSVVTGCEFGTSVEDGVLLVCESNM